MRRMLPVFLCLLFLGSISFGQSTYQKPPKEVLEVLNAPPTPVGVLSPTRTHMILAQGVRYPAIADLAQPMLRLAGLRINPANNGPHMPQKFVSYTIKSIADGSEVKIAVPAGAYLSVPRWSPDGKQFAFTNTGARSVELWIGDLTGKARQVKAGAVNAVFPGAFEWMSDSRTLLVRMVPANRGAAPVVSAVPAGPAIQESSGNAGPVRTNPDVLKNVQDEGQFEFYGTSQLALVDSMILKVTTIGTAAMYTNSESSPDGKYILVERIHKPFSYLQEYDDFPTEVEIWDRSAKMAYKVASHPLQDRVPIEGVPTGPRNYKWKPTEGATLYWVEALDEGNPKKKVAHRDRLMYAKSPFTEKPVELTQTEHRLVSYEFGEKSGTFVSDYDRDKKWVRAFYYGDGVAEPKQLWSRSAQDRYNDKGTPMMRTLASGHRAIQQDGDSIFLTSTGATAKGDRPFLNRFSLSTLDSKQLFRCDDSSYETVAALLSNDGSRFLTQHESQTEPTNFFIRTADSAKALTAFADPTPQIRGIKKQLVTYKRPDGVDLSFTLYLPPDYKAGTALPTIVWAYPLEFTDASTAGQVSGSTNRFTTISGISQLFLLLKGYAILDNTAMPVIGDPETVNNTFVQQITADAKAAIDKAAEMGVTDPNRVGVGGHSYGAFMTANLLAHTDLFKAGVARSGAYNRTLTPFGFQSERRTFWEAKDTYLGMSPFLVADKIKTPILLIHGEADNNQGTFPIQSERMYQAIRGNGGTVRYVTLPYEAHGYIARESTEHVLYEMINWFDRWVKNAKPEAVPAKAVGAAN
jgi:dipeptidyl aminopeptidase/acylaminoacyl peptidase